MDNTTLHNTALTYETLDPRRFERRNVRRAVRSYSRMFFALAVFQIIGQASALLIQLAVLFLFGSEYGSTILTNPYVIMSIQVFCLYILAFPIFCLICARIPKAQHNPTPMSLGELISLLLVSQALTTFINFITQLVVGFFEAIFGSYDNSYEMLVTDMPIWLVILVVVIIGPIIEELMFRKIFFDRMSVYGDRLAIIVTSITFGIFHGNFSQLFYTAAFGFILAFSYSKTRKIRYPILLHICSNFLGTVPALILQDRIEDISNITSAGLTDMSVLIEAIDALLVMLLSIGIVYLPAIAGAVILIVKLFKGKFKIVKRDSVYLPALAIPRVTFLNLGAILFFIVSAILFLASML